jgi:hypothetical protein
MRRILTAALAFCLVAACTNPSASPGVGTAPVEGAVSAEAKGDVVNVVTNVGKKVAVRGLQALIIAEEWYQPANRSALAAVQTRALPDSVLRKILDLNRTIRAVLDRGGRTSDDAAKAAAAAEAMRSIIDLRALLGGTG